MLLAVNHIGYVDFIYGGLAANPSGRKVRFMAKRELFDHRVDRSADAVDAPHQGRPRRGRGVTADRDRATCAPARRWASSPRPPSPGHWSSRSSRPARCGSRPSVGVPVVPVILWGTQRMMTKDHPRDLSRGKTITISVGTPLLPTGADPVAETAELHRVMSSMLDDAIRAYPASEQPEGCWWLPRGTAAPPRRWRRPPQLDAAEKAERAAQDGPRRTPAKLIVAISRLCRHIATSTQFSVFQQVEGGSARGARGARDRPRWPRWTAKPASGASVRRGLGSNLRGIRPGPSHLRSGAGRRGSRTPR